jgi:adenine-specific DNA-methyltransferase
VGKKDYSSWTKPELVEEIQKLQQRKRFGLVWEDKNEDALDALSVSLPLVSIDAKRQIGDAKENPNLLIEGDNLFSLTLLNFSHKEKVDLIYIDPPYNRGLNDFKYNDNYVNPDDAFRHSKWLSFMHKRLVLAKSLLKPTGAIFMSIDNNEMAHLKLLCDEVFGERNFIGVLIWRKKEGGGQTDQYFVTEHEYVLGYAKSPEYKWQDEVIPDGGSSFNKSDEHGKFKAVKLAKWGNTSRRIDRPTMYFPINAPDGTKIYPIAPDGEDGRWRVASKRMDALIKNDLIHWKEQDQTWIPYEKVYYSEGDLKVIKERSILYDLATTADGTKELTHIFGKKDVFENPKPVKLIEYLLERGSHKDAVVLDFFAGSGTTGHGVLSQNQNDEGTRQFILCTNNEESIAEEITYPRIKKVIEGYKDTKGNPVAGLPGSLQYLKVTDSPSASTDANKRKLSKSASHLLCLKESCFEQTYSDKSLNIFRGKSKSLAVLLDSEEIELLKQHVNKDSDEKFVVYIFSLSGDLFDEEFEEFGNRVSVQPIPESLLNSYKQVMRRIGKKS